MKEFPTEEQANQAVLILSILVPVVSLAFGFYQKDKVKKEERKILWLNTALCAVIGPIIWFFWQVYNSIENYYGLDSLKALKINFLIAVGLGAVFFILFTYAPRLVQGPRTSLDPSPRNRK